MKTLVVLLLLAGMIPSFADITLTQADVTALYGSPLFKNTSPEKYRSEGVDIIIYWTETRIPQIKSITFLRSTKFFQMDFDELLKPISCGDTWTQKDDTTWVLPQARVTAKWDGENKLTVTPDVPPRE